MDTFRVTAPALTPERLSGRYERALLCVKGQHTEAAVRRLAPFLAEDGYAVSVQNGLNEPAMAAVLGQDRVIGCFVNFGADYLEPGRVHFGGRGAVVLGELEGEITPRLHALLAVFRDFDPDARASANIWGYLWGKLGYGALLFATALGNESIADALAHPPHRALYRALGEEVMRVADASGIAPEGFNGFDPAGFVPGADAALTERSMAAMVAYNRGSAKSHSGVWRDPRRPQAADGGGADDRRRRAPGCGAGDRDAAAGKAHCHDPRGRGRPPPARPRQHRRACGQGRVDRWRARSTTGP